MKARTLAAAALIAISSQAGANIDIQFDYTYDTSGFFADPNRRAALESAASVFEGFGDSLSAIASTGPSANSFDVSFFNPSAPGSTVSLQDISVGSNVIRVYAGATDYAGNSLGQGGFGGFSCSGFGSFCSDAGRRGQGVASGAAAIDVSVWGGSISFDTGTAWHFGTTTTGLDAFEYDFYSVATHELAHVLGFGTSRSFDNRVNTSTGQFLGATTGTVALTSDQGHWADGTLSQVGGITQEAAMTASITQGVRKYFTALDYAAMQDIGWQVSAVPETSTSLMMLMGLFGVSALTAQRRAQGHASRQGA